MTALAWGVLIAGLVQLVAAITVFNADTKTAQSPDTAGKNSGCTEGIQTHGADPVCRFGSADQYYDQHDDRIVAGRPAVFPGCTIPTA